MRQWGTGSGFEIHPEHAQVMVVSGGLNCDLSRKSHGSEPFLTSSSTTHRPTPSISSISQWLSSGRTVPHSASALIIGGVTSNASSPFTPSVSSRLERSYTMSLARTSSAIAMVTTHIMPSSLKANAI